MDASFGRKGSMGIFGDYQRSFEATITILPLGPTTQLTHPFNGIRRDFCYMENLNERGWAVQTWMIFPEFVDGSGVAINGTVPLQFACISGCISSPRKESGCISGV